MLPKLKLAAVALLFVSCALSSAQEAQKTIKLTIKSNRRVQPDPAYLTFRFDHQTVRASVRAGKFDVPAGVSRSKTWALLTTVGGDRIQVANLSWRELEYEDWTLVLADDRFDEDYISAVPKGADIPSSCVLVLESIHKDPGTVLFQSNCRSRLTR